MTIDKNSYGVALLCRLGIHRWAAWAFAYEATHYSRVRRDDEYKPASHGHVYKRTCASCGKPQMKEIQP